MSKSTPFSSFSFVLLFARLLASESINLEVKAVLLGPHADLVHKIVGHLGAARLVACCRVKTHARHRRAVRVAPVRVMKERKKIKEKKRKIKEVSKKKGLEFWSVVLLLQQLL